MFGRRQPPRPKRPDNLLPINRHGFALWELWSDDGPGTVAEPAKNGMRTLYFLSDEDAAAYGRKLAEAYPDRRFKPVTR